MGMIALLTRLNKETLDAILEDSSLLEDRIYPDEPLNDGSDFIDIDKSWDGILYLLSPENRFQGELGKVLFSGRAIDEEQDLGYGPAQYSTPEEVAALHEKISGITAEELAANFDAAKMEEDGVYPSFSDDPEEIAYLTDNFKEIQRLYSEAAKNGQAVITWLS